MSTPDADRVGHDIATATAEIQARRAAATHALVALRAVGRALALLPTPTQDLPWDEGWRAPLPATDDFWAAMVDLADSLALLAALLADRTPRSAQEAIAVVATCQLPRQLLADTPANTVGSLSGAVVVLEELILCLTSPTGASR